MKCKDMKEEILEIKASHVRVKGILAEDRILYDVAIDLIMKHNLTEEYEIRVKRELPYLDLSKPALTRGEK